MLNDLKLNIDKLSGVLNNMLTDGIEYENYSEVLKVSQELDKLIFLYTKLTTRALGIEG